MTFTVTCPSCSSMFPVDPAKIPPNGVRAQCSICPEIFDVEEAILAKELDDTPPGAETGVVEVPPPADESEPSPESTQINERSAEDKEKSLVRSLASDIIGYNPEEHSETLAAGTFKEVFDGDVEGSLKEYQEQVESDAVAQGKPPSSMTP